MAEIKKTPQERHIGRMALYNRTIIQAISDKLDISNGEALQKFYNSELYIQYSDEDTKVWHFSCKALADMLAYELRHGKLVIPSEV
ncbi:MAG: hypothetical protein LBP57_05040 [Endomicrobium sp.]|nr:hypothetical protein [Endomicrobium sp.]